MGSWGQRTGSWYAGVDDFTLITPDFEALIRREDGAEGSITDLLIDTSPLESIGYTSRYTYDHVMGNSSGNYINDNALNDLKVLMIADSFAKSVNPYVILSFREIRNIDNYNSQEVTTEFMEKYSPDVVILLYYPDFLHDDSNKGFSFSVY